MPLDICWYEFANGQLGIPSEGWGGRGISGAVAWDAGRERGDMAPEGTVGPRSPPLVQSSSLEAAESKGHISQNSQAVVIRVQIHCRLMSMRSVLFGAAFFHREGGGNVPVFLQHFSRHLSVAS